jgi:DNA-binding NtrC family response regulator
MSELLALRAQVLQAAGYAVFTTRNAQEADFKIRRGECGVLLLCYSVANYWRRILIKDFREHCPAGRIVAITNHPVVGTPEEVDELVYGVEGPEVLMDAIQPRAA